MITTFIIQSNENCTLFLLFLMPTKLQTFTLQLKFKYHCNAWLVGVSMPPFSTKIGYIGDKDLD